MKSAVAFLIQLSIVAAVVVGVLYILRIGEEHSSKPSPSAPETEQVQPAKPAGSEDPESDSEPSAAGTDSVVKEEHAPPELS